MNGNSNKRYGLLFLPPVAALPGGEDRHIDRLTRSVPTLSWKRCTNKEEFIELLPNAEAALVWSFPAKLNDRIGNLRLLSTPAAGREMIRAEKKPGLEISFGTFHGELMAETVLGMMLGMVRGIEQSLEPMRADGWPRQEVGTAVRPLKGSHAVILGFGHIGKHVGRLLKAFGVRLTGVNRTNLDRPDYFGDGDTVITIDDLDTVLPQTDHLVMVLPGDTGTDHCVDARRLALLPTHGYVYNIGRGNSLDLDALVTALNSGRIAGAGLDVFPEEPLPADAPIRRCPHVLLTPHTSAFAPNYIDLYIDELLPHLQQLFS